MLSIVAHAVMNSTTFIYVPRPGRRSEFTSKRFRRTRLHPECRYASGEPCSTGVTGSRDAPGAPRGSPLRPTAPPPPRSFHARSRASNSRGRRTSARCASSRRESASAPLRRGRAGRSRLGGMRADDCSGPPPPEFHSPITGRIQEPCSPRHFGARSAFRPDTEGKSQHCRARIWIGPLNLHRAFARRGCPLKSRCRLRSAPPPDAQGEPCTGRGRVEAP
jgi:hypothetical protein